MNTETILINRLEGRLSSNIHIINILKNEVKGVLIEFISINGFYKLEGLAQSGVSDVLLTIQGKAVLQVDNADHEINSSTIVRTPYFKRYSIVVDKGEEFSFIRLRKILDKKDVGLIENNIKKYNTLYFKSLADCPTYKEDIKSEKTLNRMILPEGLVPRFAMGSVETEGPDEVGEHNHPMLDQIFFGLKDCRCSCFADGEETVLTENMMLHIPLGSKHYVSVAEGDKLAYIWMDFFLTLKGEKYMGEQHQMDEE